MLKCLTHIIFAVLKSIFTHSQGTNKILLWSNLLPYSEDLSRLPNDILFWLNKLIDQIVYDCCYYFSLLDFLNMPTSTVFHSGEIMYVLTHLPLCLVINLTI